MKKIKGSLIDKIPTGQDEQNSDKKNENISIEIYDFNQTVFIANKYEESQIGDIELSPVENGLIRWINIDGLNTEETIAKFCKPYNIHPLVMEDILNTEQRAKIEDYDDYLFLVAKMVYFVNEELIKEQINIIIGNGYIISIGEKKGDVFDKIRERIKNEGSHIRKNSADYLAYSILDAIVDGYFYVLEKLGDKIDDSEEELLRNPTIEYLHNMRKIKKDLMFIHKSIWPLREVASWMERDDTRLIQHYTQIYIRDVYDHIIQCIDTTETYRELLSGLMELYLSSISNRMNEVMKVLTIISTIFIPLTFIAGVYGMNFHYMPELSWKWGYALIALIMITVALAMIAYFKKKKWF